MTWSGPEWDLSAAIRIRPQTPRELFEYVHAYYKTASGQPIKVAHRAICPGHSAPFEALRDGFFERYSKTFWKGNRGGGKTDLIALLSHLDTFFRGRLTGHPLETLVVGANAEQGKKAHLYYSGFWALPDFLPYAGPKSLLKETVCLPDGSSFKTAVATITATNGPHVPRFYGDELELWDSDALQQALSIAQSDGYHRAAMRFTSTQKFATGLVQKWLDEMPAKGFKIYTWCIFEVLEPCPPERSCSRCPLFQWPDHEGGPLCGGKAKFSTGYYQIDDFLDKVDSLDRTTLEAEWLCMRPSRKGLVFSRDWVENKHRVPMPIAYDPGLPLELTMDQGFTNPWAVEFVQHDALHDQARVFDEVYMTESLAEEVAKTVADKLERHGVSPEQKIITWVDPEDPQAAATFRKHCISSRGARYNLILRVPGGKQDLLAYLEDLRILLKIPRSGRPRLVVGAGVTNLPAEFNAYHYPDGKDGRPVSEAPVDKYNHAISALYRWASQFRTQGKARTAKDPRRR